MAHHKRRRAKNQRAGCLMCKPHKANNAKDTETLQEYRANVNKKEALSEVVEDDVSVMCCYYCTYPDAE
jgi:hypothetical protein